MSILLKYILDSSACNSWNHIGLSIQIPPYLSLQIQQHPLQLSIVTHLFVKMFFHAVLVVGLFLVFTSASTTLGGPAAACSYTTIWYNSATDLQASMSSISSSYSICNATTTTTQVSTTSTAAPAATTTAPCKILVQAPCFYIIGHGESHIEGAKLGAVPGLSNPRFDAAVPSIWYIDSASHLNIADTSNTQAMTYYIGTESWWGQAPQDAPAKYGTDYQPSTCTANADGTLDCFQYGGIQNNIINVWEYTYAPDTRAFYMPHWGNAAFMQTITLTWQQTTCPNLC